jgi:hypothetical protein
MVLFFLNEEHSVINEVIEAKRFIDDFSISDPDPHWREISSRKGKI